MAVCSTGSTACSRPRPCSSADCSQLGSDVQGLAVLGATGTIGLNTLDVAGRYPERFRIVALSAQRDVERLAELCRRHRPVYAVVGDGAAAARLRDALGDIPEVRVLQGA